jgi:myosin heavy subunit
VHRWWWVFPQLSIPFFGEGLTSTAKIDAHPTETFTFKKNTNMIRSLLKLGLFLVAGILVYNYFFGDSQEKEQSREVFRQTGKTVGAAWNLLKAEKQKFDAGKYDTALDKLGGAYREIRERAQYVDQNVLNRLSELEKRKAALEKELDGIESEEAAPPPAPTKKGVAKPDQSSKNAAQDARKKRLAEEMEQLMNDTEQLLRQAQE